MVAGRLSLGPGFLVSGTALSGGAGLTGYLAHMQANLHKASSVRVGFLENSTYPDGTSVPMVAAIQEFGAPGAGIPPRPYFRTMIKAKSGGWGDALATNLPLVDFDAQKALGRMGEGIKEQLQQSIIDLVTPALSPVTIMLRWMRVGKVDAPVTFAMVKEARRRVASGETPGHVSDKPLIDSGNLINSADYEVE